MHRLDLANNRTNPFTASGSLPGAGATGRPGPESQAGSADPFAALLKTRLSSAPAQELLSSEAVRAPAAQEPRSGRRSKVGAVDVAGHADLASIAADELGQRGQTRLTVEAATKSAQTHGEQSENLADQDGQEPALVDVDGEGMKRSGAARSADVRTPAADAADSTDATQDGVDARSSVNGGVKERVSQGRADERSTDTGAQKQDAGAPGSGAQAAVQGSTASAATAAATTAGAASVRVDSQGAGPASNTSAQPVSGVTAAGRAESARKSLVPTGPQDPRGARGPEEGAESAAPGVKGQAMRGVFAILRGTQAGTTAAVIRLTPEHLGDLKINLSMSEGKLSAILGASSEQARADLEASVPELREALHGRGILVESIEVRREPERSGQRGEGETPDPSMHEQDSSGLAGDSRSGSPDEREQHTRAGAGRDGVEDGNEESSVLTGEESPVIQGAWNAVVDLTA